MAFRVCLLKVQAFNFRVQCFWISIPILGFRVCGLSIKVQGFSLNIKCQGLGLCHEHKLVRVRAQPATPNPDPKLQALSLKLDTPTFQKTRQLIGIQTPMERSDQRSPEGAELCDRSTPKSLFFSKRPSTGKTYFLHIFQKFCDPAGDPVEKYFLWNKKIMWMENNLYFYIFLKIFIFLHFLC